MEYELDLTFSSHYPTPATPSVDAWPVMVRWLAPYKPHSIILAYPLSSNRLALFPSGAVWAIDLFAHPPPNQPKFMWL